MAVETLKLEITADNKQAVASLQAMNNMLAKFQRALKSATDPSHVQYLQRNIDFLNGKIADLKKNMGIAGGAVKNNTQAWLNWGRVIQDAPYGLNGIANNLTQVIPAVGALGFAFSAVISALTFAQVGFGAWTRGSKKAKEETDKFTESLAKEQVNLKVLYQTATNANQPLEIRNKSVKELREQYGNYLKNFSDEAILAGKAATAYNALSDALVKTAKARAAQERLQENQKKQLDIELQIAQESKKTAESIASAKSVNVISKGANDAASRLITREEIVAGLAEAGLNSVQALGKQLQKLREESKFFEQSIQANQVKPFTDELKKGYENAKSFADEVKRLVENTVLFKGDKRLQFAVGAKDERDKNMPQPKPFGGFITSDFLKGYDDAIKRGEQYKAQIEEITKLSEKLGQTFVNNIFSGQALGEALVNVFKSIAQEIAAAAAKALIFKLLTSVLNPAGLGLSSAFSFKDLFSQFLGVKMASGGITQGPTPALIGEAGPEAVLPLDKLGSFIDRAARIGADSMKGSQGMNLSGEFAIRGQDLVLALNRAGYNLSLRR